MFDTIQKHNKYIPNQGQDKDKTRVQKPQK